MTRVRRRMYQKVRSRRAGEELRVVETLFGGPSRELGAVHADHTSLTEIPSHSFIIGKPGHKQPRYDDAGNV